MLDDLDLRIYGELEIDARQSTRQLAKKLGIPHTTISRRINKLIGGNLLRIVALANPESLGYCFWVMIGLNVKLGWVESVARRLLIQPACYSVSEAFGRFDVIVCARFRSYEEMNQFVKVTLPTIQGIRSSETSLLNQPVKHEGFVWNQE